MSNKNINDLLKYSDRLILFSDNFNRTNTYAVNRNPEVSDGNNWYAYSNWTSSGVGIYSNCITFGNDNTASIYNSYRRQLENYSLFKRIELLFDYTTSNGNGAMFGCSIGSNILINALPNESFFDGGVQFKILNYGNTIRIDNGSNKASASFAFTANTAYTIKIVSTPTFMGVKIWLKSGSEPTIYTIQYNGALTKAGSFLALYSGNASSSAGSEHYVDNLSVSINK